MRRSQRDPGVGGAAGGPTRPPKPRVVHGTGRGYVLWICKADIEGGMYSIVDLFQIAVYCTEAEGRRSTRDTISALHAADACRLPALRH